MDLVNYEDDLCYLVYLIEFNSGHIYIGSTKNIKRRISQHKNNHEFEEFFKGGYKLKILYDKQLKINAKNREKEKIRHYSKIMGQKFLNKQSRTKKGY